MELRAGKGDIATGGAQKVVALAILMFCSMDHGKAGKQMHAEPFRAWQQAAYGQVCFARQEQSKTRFLENLEASIITLVARQAISEYMAEQVDPPNIMHNVREGLKDMPTLLEPAAQALIYVQFGHPGLSVKNLCTSAIDMEHVYKSADDQLAAFSPDVTPLLTGKAVIFQYKGQAAKGYTSHPHFQGVQDFIENLSIRDAALLCSLLQSAVASLRIKFREFCQDQLPSGQHTRQALEARFGSEWVEKLPIVPPSNNLQEATLGMRNCQACRNHNGSEEAAAGLIAFKLNKTADEAIQLEADNAEKLLSYCNQISREMPTNRAVKAGIRKKQAARNGKAHEAEG